MANKLVFTIHGHENLLATHKMTLEFTKDNNLTKRGDCIVGVDADFSYEELKRILGCKKAKLIIEADGLKDEVNFDINPDFCDKHEIVIRKTDFRSDRTLGINADKAAINLNKAIISYLKDPKHKASVIISPL
jgi:hypothetical protein